MLRICRILTLALTLTVGWSTTCSAVSLNFLIDSDFFVRDPLTGGRWLDLTTSTNMSYNQVSTMMSPGQLFDGWRHATVDEVIDMLGHGGIYNPYYFQAVVSQQTFDATEEVMELFGVTAFQNGGTFIRKTSSGITGDFDPIFQNRNAISIGTIDWVAEEMDDLGSFSSFGVDEPDAFASTGHWLVNAGSTEEGEGEDAPFQPTSTGTNGEKMFSNTSGAGYWYDPPADDMTFATDGNSLFTVIGMPLDFPDSDGLYTITDSENGTFTMLAGEFLTLPTPVSEFTISDIDVSVDEGDPVFAACLQFDQTNVNFTITPVVPEPSGLALAGLALLMSLFRRVR